MRVDSSLVVQLSKGSHVIRLISLTLIHQDHPTAKITMVTTDFVEAIEIADYDYY